VRDLNEELQLAKDGVRAAKARENSLKEELENLNMDLQRSQKSHNKLQSEKEALEDQLNEQKKKVQRLSSGLQVRLHVFPIQRGSLPLVTCTINVHGLKIPVSLILRVILPAAQSIWTVSHQPSFLCKRRASAQCLVEQSTSLTAVNTSRHHCVAPRFYSYWSLWSLERKITGALFVCIIIVLFTY